MGRIPALVVAILVITGCSGSSTTTQPKPQAPSYPSNDTPTHAAARLIGTYEHKSTAAYAAMFTGNFTYEFSNATDPTLVQQYSTGWFKVDEKASSSHLFSGYTPPGGTTLPAASAITINLAVSIPIADSTGGLDPITHKFLPTRVDGSFVVPEAGGTTLTYEISNNYNIFYFVRGDSAVGLDASQPADSSHWYVYKWVDQTVYASPARSRLQTQPSTWGRVKGLYH
jgi:hypothetical protein